MAEQDPFEGWETEWEEEDEHWGEPGYRFDWASKTVEEAASKPVSFALPFDIGPKRFCKPYEPNVERECIFTESQWKRYSKFLKNNNLPMVFTKKEYVRTAPLDRHFNFKPYKKPHYERSEDTETFSCDENEDEFYEEYGRYTRKTVAVVLDGAPYCEEWDLENQIHLFEKGNNIIKKSEKSSNEK